MVLLIAAAAFVVAFLFFPMAVVGWLRNKVVTRAGEWRNLFPKKD